MGVLRIAPEAWCPSEGITLEANAIRVVRSTTSLSVVAGPGAGKTELLAQRACYLLQTNACPYPKRILAISFKKDSAQNLADRVLARCGREAIGRFNSLTFDSFTKSLLDRFGKSLPESDKIDLDYEITFQAGEIGKSKLTFSKIAELVQLIMNSNVHLLRAVRATYSHVFLDEFQDTTSQQYDLLCTIFRSTDAVVTAVGDDRQKIMGWAGALPNGFERFETDFEAERVPLFMNFRSAPKLIFFQTQLARSFMGMPMTVQPADHWDDSEGESSVLHFSNSAVEARHMARWIRSLVHNEGVLPREICILARKKIPEFTSEFAHALRTEGIQCRDEEAFQRYLKDPFGEFLSVYLEIVFATRRLPSEILKLRSLAEGVIGASSLKEDSRQYQLFDKELQSIVLKHRDNIHRTPSIDCVVRGLQELVSWIGVSRILSRYSHLRDEKAVGEIVNWYIEGLKRYLHPSGVFEDAWRQLVGVDAVPMMTIHKSKGQEFEAVVLLAAEPSAFSSRSFNGPEESKNLFVAFSRAKSKFRITRCDYRLLYGRQVPFDQNEQFFQKFYSCLNEIGMPYELISE